MELKDILLKYRSEHHLSQREFARRSNLSNSLISILEMGKNPQTGKKTTPDMETYKKLADAMGVTLQYLFEQLGDSELVNIASTYKDQLSPDEHRLVTAYREAEPPIRSAALTMLENSAASMAAKRGESEEEKMA